MNRRGFLKGIIATATAPAFIRAENAMSLWVPVEEPISPDAILISMVRKHYPTIIAQDLVGVQPMSSPNGVIFTLEPAYHESIPFEELLKQKNIIF